jgi:hypothetical protein
MWLKNTNSLYIHIPKCGGMALRNYFDHEPLIPGEVHWSLQKHINLNQGRVEKSFVFTTVRNIYEQLISMWVYYAKKDKDGNVVQGKVDTLFDIDSLDLTTDKWLILTRTTYRSDEISNLLKEKNQTMV